MELNSIIGWLAGIALIAAMIPQQVRAIRWLCLAAGVLASAYFAMSEGLGIGLALMLVFTLINAARLMQLRRRARSGAMNDDERALFAHVMKVEDPTHQSRLRDLMQWADIAPGALLIEQGQKEPPFIYVASGLANIERDKAVVNTCGAGEFLGEMSHVSGNEASASVIAAEPMRIARIDRDALAQLAVSLPEIGAALDRAVNQSLTDKVMRMNQQRD